MKRRNFILGGLAAITASASTKALAHEHKPTRTEVRYHDGIRVNLNSNDYKILEETIWGETRGESDLGKMAVVHVILNRYYSNDNRFKNSKSISEICLKKKQFSCWLNKFKMRHIKHDVTYKHVKDIVHTAIKLYSLGIDYSNGALFYYSEIIDKPKWAKEMKHVNKIGLHDFYV